VAPHESLFLDPLRRQLRRNVLGYARAGLTQQEKEENPDSAARKKLVEITQRAFLTLSETNDKGTEEDDVLEV
jgi:hypothetical protein